MNELKKRPHKCARNMQTKSLFVLFLVGCLGQLVIQTSYAQDMGKCSVTLLDGKTVEGTISGIDAEGIITGNGLPAGIKLQDILSVETTKKANASTEEGIVTIVPLEGGMLKVRNVLLADEKLTFDTQTGIGSMPLQTVRAIVWANANSVKQAIAKPSTGNDIIIAKPGDEEIILEGLFESIDAERIGMKYEGESQSIGLEKMMAVITADVKMDAPAGSSASVNLIDGSRLVGVIKTVADGMLSMEIAGDATISLKTSSIVDITITSDRVQYLSDAEPIQVDERAVFTIQRTWKRDRSIEDNALSIRIGKTPETVEFKKGIGTQSFSRLVFSNTKEFDRFNATVGIDAETKGRGDCQMTVRGDGIELWSKRVQGSGKPQKVDVDISGIKEVELVVYPGEEFDLGDHANWCDAKFLKTK